MTGTFRRDTVERLMRGGAGSALVHGVFIGLLFLPLQVSHVVDAPVEPRSTVVAPKSEGPVARDADLPFRNPPDTDADVRLSIENGPGGADFRIDLARIRERRNDLFPFVTWNLRFLRERARMDGDGGLAYGLSLGEIPPAGGPPLNASSEQIQRMVDRAWSRRDRWSNLQELMTLADRYNADHGDLPVLFREYLRQNVPQPYDDWGDPDPVYWITLMLAADDAPLVEFIGRYARRHPASRTTTELLFLLDASAETSCDVLLRVLRAGSAELPLRVTQVDNPDAYDLAMSLAETYRSWVLRHHAQLPEVCLAARVDALRRIIDTSPDHYGVADARFRMGQMLWQAGRRDEAIEWWSGMTADERDQYGAVRKALLGALADGTDYRIPGILRDQELRWQTAAQERLEHFGSKPTDF